MTRLYVAGPMTGLPEYNFPAFRAAARQLRAVGYDVLDPSRHGADVPGYGWADYMRLGIRDVLDADGLALLPGAHNSRGARLERVIAEGLGLPVRPIDEWLQAAATEVAS